MVDLPDILAGKRRLTLLRLIGNGLGQALAGLGGALALRQVFDHHMFGKQQTAALWEVGLVLCVAALVGALLKWQERVDSERLGQGYARDIRLQLFDHLSRVSPRQLQRRRQGGLVLHFVGDMTALRQWASRGLARLWVAGMMALGVVAGLLYLNPRLAAIVVGILALGTCATWATGAAMEHRVRAARRRQGQLASNINEKLAHLPVIQAFGQRQNESRSIALQSRRLVQAMVSRARVAGLVMGIAALTASLASIGVVLGGALLGGSASPGTVLAAITLVSLLATPLHQLGRIAELWRAARLSREKLRRVLQLGSPIVNAPAPRHLRPGPGRIRFENVSVDGALQAFSAIAEGGERVVVTGAHGSGKSTLLALVPRLIEPDHGRIVIDGRDISLLTLGSLRRAVSMVSSDLPLLRGSLDMNLRYRKPGASPSELQRMLTLCEVSDIVARLPRGLDTMLSEAAANLSYGERRRLMWARALLGDPRILLLDDVDTSLDPDSRQLLAGILRQYSGTVLMATQQPDLFGLHDAVWSLPSVPAVAIERGEIPSARSSNSLAQKQASP